MKKIIGGVIAIVLGIACFAAVPGAFFKVVMGVLPFILLVSGGLAVYLGYESRSENNELSFDVTEPDPSDDAGEMGTLLGNTDTQVFHKSDCNFAQSKNCTASFKSREDALEQGYKPCGVCNP